MFEAVRRGLRSILHLFRTDLERDRFLRYILLAAFVLCGFWFWWRVPYFATPDEYGRLLRPMKAVGYFAANPGFDAFARGATDGVPQGATFYLYAVTTAPAGIMVLLTGSLGEFASFAEIGSRWDLWHAVPSWYWSASILAARFANVSIAVGCVYLAYRIGSAARNRRAGQYSALLLTLTLAFIATAHEMDEDTALLFALLLTVYLSVRYVQAGTDRLALGGAIAGGFAIAFKLTGGATVLILATALVLRRHREGGGGRVASLESVLRRPKLLATMAVIGATTIYLGRPNALFNGPGELVYRLTWASSYSSAAPFVSAPSGYAQLHALLAATGLPLALGIIGALGWHGYKAGYGEGVSFLFWLLVPAMILYIAVFSAWTHIRPHHVLPFLTLGVLLLAVPLSTVKWRDGGRGAQMTVAILLATTAVYAGAGTASFATDPRDQASDWIATTVPQNDTVMVYENSVADVGMLHGRPVDHYDFYEAEVVEGSTLNETAYTDWIVQSPERGPEYIQVTAWGARYADPHRRVHHRYPRRAAFFDRLVYGDHYGYEVAAEFGEKPRRRGFAERLLRAGIEPSIEKREPYVLILRRTEDSE